jgi:hypothetical protein
MTDPLLWSVVHLQALRVVLWHRLVKDESGEGVISASIAVLVMAFLGALMWIGFRSIFQDAESNTRDQVRQIGG